MRLDKFLTDMGAGTRSQIKDMAKKGRIQVNGETVKKTEIKVDPAADTVVCGGVRVAYAAMEYYMLNKPQGLVSATEDNLHRTVIDLIKSKPPKGESGEKAHVTGPRRKDLFPVGRLDIDTEGLLLITNDGELAHHLLSPRHHVDKVYFAQVSGALPENVREQFARGITLSDGTPTMGAVLTLLDHEPRRNREDREQETDGQGQEDGKISRILLTIREGKFHQVKRMFEAVGCRVVFLKRVSMGSLKLDETLEPGEYRPLSQEEVERLRMLPQILEQENYRNQDKGKG